VSDPRPGGSTGDPLDQPAAEPLKDLPGAGALLALGTTIALCVALGVVVGLWADQAWGTSPWGLMGGLVLGTGLAVVSVVSLVRKWL
jgi:F0F1-type ATP synthase assembly protein I